MRWCQSRPLRARREASMQKIAPIDPAHTKATSFWNPGRSIVPDPDRPRSSSMMATDAKPIVRDLPHARLPHIDHGSSAEVVKRDLRIHHALRSFAFLHWRPRRAPPEAGRPVPGPVRVIFALSVVRLLRG